MSDEKRPEENAASHAPQHPAASGRGRPRKDQPQQRPARKDTIDHAIGLLWSAIDELERGHPSIKATLAQGIIQHAIATLETIAVEKFIKQYHRPPKN